MAARKKKFPRIVHVQCASPTGYRWLRLYVRGAKALPQGEGFAVTDEAAWAESLRAAEGREV